jgi:hypothetical protein
MRDFNLLHTVCIRKIVTALNAMLRDNKPWPSAIA